MAEPEEGKVFDVTSGQWKDATPTGGEEEAAKKAAEETEEKKSEESTKKQEDDDSAPSGAEAAAAKGAAEQKKTEETNIKKDELPAWLKEKYKIETQEELDEILSNSNKLVDELEKERNKKIFKSN